MPGNCTGVNIGVNSSRQSWWGKRLGMDSRAKSSPSPLYSEIELKMRLLLVLADSLCISSHSALCSSAVYWLYNRRCSYSKDRSVLCSYVRNGRLYVGAVHKRLFVSSRLVRNSYNLSTFFLTSHTTQASCSGCISWSRVPFLLPLSVHLSVTFHGCRYGSVTLLNFVSLCTLSIYFSYDLLNLSYYQGLISPLYFMVVGIFQSVYLNQRFLSVVDVSVPCLLIIARSSQTCPADQPECYPDCLHHVIFFCWYKSPRALSGSGHHCSTLNFVPGDGSPPWRGAGASH